MSTLMIALEDAQKAIRSIIEEYDRALKAEREAGLALLLAGKLKTAERAYEALESVPAREAVDIAATRIVDKKWIPEEMHGEAEDQAIRTLLRDLGEYMSGEGVIKMTKAPGRLPTQTKITLRLTALTQEGGKQE